MTEKWTSFDVILRELTTMIGDPIIAKDELLGALIQGKIRSVQQRQRIHELNQQLEGAPYEVSLDGEWWAYPRRVNQLWPGGSWCLALSQTIRRAPEGLSATQALPYLLPPSGRSESLGEVKLWKLDVSACFPQLDTHMTAAPSASNSTGRPPSYDWDASGAAYDARVKELGHPDPLNEDGWQRQADVVRWVMRLIEQDTGQEPGSDSQAKTYARTWMTRSAKKAGK